MQYEILLVSSLWSKNCYDLYMSMLYEYVCTFKINVDSKYIIYERERYN